MKMVLGAITIVMLALVALVVPSVSATMGAPASAVPPELPRRHVESWHAAPMFTPSCVNGAFPGTEEDPARTVCCQAIPMCVEKFTRPPIKSLVSAHECVRVVHGHGWFRQATTYMKAHPDGSVYEQIARESHPKKSQIAFRSLNTCRSTQHAITHPTQSHLLTVTHSITMLCDILCMMHRVTMDALPHAYKASVHQRRTTEPPPRR